MTVKASCHSYLFLKSNLSLRISCTPLRPSTIGPSPENRPHLSAPLRSRVATWFAYHHGLLDLENNARNPKIIWDEGLSPSGQEAVEVSFLVPKTITKPPGFFGVPKEKRPAFHKILPEKMWMASGKLPRFLKWLFAKRSGWWLNQPFEKCDRQNGNSSPKFGWKFQKHLSCHHLEIYFNWCNCWISEPSTNLLQILIHSTLQVCHATPGANPQKPFACSTMRWSPAIFR